MDPAKTSSEEKPAGDAPAAVSDPAEVKQSAPTDALSKTNEELSEEAAQNPDNAEPEKAPVIKPKGIKAVLKKINVYLLLFGLVVVIVAATGAVSYLNSKKAPKAPGLETQELTTDALKQLANSDSTVGSASQTLTVQGNAIISGQLLVRKDLDVAGSLKLGGELLTQNITVSGKSNLAETQVNSLQVSQNTALQGTTTMKDLNVAGVSAFSGPVTISQLTVTRLILAGNGSLTIPNHLSFNGSAPGRSIIDAGSLGAGGTVSVNGSDTAGTINVNTGLNPAAGCFVKVNFAQAFTSMPHVIIGPVNSAAGNLQYYVTRTTTSFSLCSNNAAASSQVFAFDYFITG